MCVGALPAMLVGLDASLKMGFGADGTPVSRHFRRALACLVIGVCVHSTANAHGLQDHTEQHSDHDRFELPLKDLLESEQVPENRPAYMEPGFIPQVVNRGSLWPVTRTEWSAEDEVGYANFVQAIGRSACGSIEDCLGDEANPYRDTDKRYYTGDCADMVYTLRAYYAWKNALPFSHQSRMAAKDKKATDPRFSPTGNKVAARRDAIAAKPIHAPSYIAALRNIVSTAMFRTDPREGEGALFDDFYPIAISRQSVRPGVIAYDIYGHVGMVYDVTDDGRILIVASHPDNSVTRSVFGHNFLRAAPALGAGLKAWRPIALEGARRGSDGVYHGGRIRGAANDEIEDYSLEQFFGTHPHPDEDWRYGDFIFGDRTLSFYDFVRRSLAAPDFEYSPVDELRTGLGEICIALHDRRVNVQHAIDAGLHKKKHPSKLPPNIYGAYGSWESYSTPSRDARLKIAFIELRRAIERYVQLVRSSGDGVRYEGRALEADLLKVWQEENENCRLIYRRSDGTRVRLTIDHIAKRLFDLSFDPYHCPELRWGARGVELETCEDGPVKRRWYDAQRWLRNQARRTYDIRMDFTLEELKPPSIASPQEGGLGVEEPADADLGAYLLSIQPK